MVGSGHLVSYSVTTEKMVELAVDEVLATITDDGSRNSKAREDDVSEQSFHCIGVRILARHCFHPLGNIVNCHQDVLVPTRRWKRSHEVNAPDIKDVYLKNGVEGHLIPVSYTHLTLPTKRIV